MQSPRLLDRIRTSETTIPVAVLGATGMVGQVFVHLLASHPRFRLTALCASDAKSGRPYNDACRWQIPVTPPPDIMDMELTALSPDLLDAAHIPIVFSALPADTAAKMEPALARRGMAVFSNAGAMRMSPDVPILIPDVNPESLALIRKQGWPDRGFVVTNANCAVTGLATALAPLKQFDIKEVMVSTCQSVSGAGYPGLSSMDIDGNVIPFIPGEEEKIGRELDKILGRPLKTCVTAVRVPVRFGHLETVWVRFASDVSTQDVHTAWDRHRGPAIPSMPAQPVVYLEGCDQPQPKLSFAGDPAGMSVFTGRLRKKGNRIGFVLLVNNIVKGAAGGSVTNAELFLDQLEHL